VFVSEYAAQDPNWLQVAEFNGYKSLSKGRSSERLYRVLPA
jgi:hypothetical protein